MNDASCSTWCAVARWWQAATIAADRFHRPRLVMLVNLVTADHRVNHHADATAELTAVPSTCRLAGWSVATASTVACWITFTVTDGPIIVWLVVTVSVLWTEHALNRLRRSWRQFTGLRGHGWVLSDVATIPHRNAGDRLLDDLTRHADDTTSTLGLTVRVDNDVARRLYERHGFQQSRPAARQRLTYQRPPIERVTTNPSTWSHLATDTLAAAGAINAALLLVHGHEPTIWLIPTVVAAGTTATVNDLQQQRIPNRLTLAGFTALAMTTAALTIAGHPATRITGALTGTAVMALPLLAAHLATRGHTPGLGDVKLAGVLGGTCGAIHPTIATTALITSLTAGCVFGITYQRRHNTRQFPLAPSLTAGALLALALALALAPHLTA